MLAPRQRLFRLPWDDEAPVVPRDVPKIGTVIERSEERILLTSDESTKTLGIAGTQKTIITQVHSARDHIYEEPT